MSAFKPQQHRLQIDGRSFHFVAYEANPGSVARNRPAEPAMWCLMVEGRRCPVAPFVPTQTLESVEKDLAHWVEQNVLRSA
jgi:hypothetical protein